MVWSSILFDRRNWRHIHYRNFHRYVALVAKLWKYCNFKTHEIANVGINDDFISFDMSLNYTRIFKFLKNTRANRSKLNSWPSLIVYFRVSDHKYYDHYCFFYLLTSFYEVGIQAFKARNCMRFCQTFLRLSPFFWSLDHWQSSQRFRIHE